MKFIEHDFNIKLSVYCDTVMFIYYPQHQTDTERLRFGICGFIFKNKPQVSKIRATVDKLPRNNFLIEELNIFKAFYADSTMVVVYSSSPLNPLVRRFLLNQLPPYNKLEAPVPKPD